jgi:hypothetical protein
VICVVAEFNANAYNSLVGFHALPLNLCITEMILYDQYVALVVLVTDLGQKSIE